MLLYSVIIYASVSVVFLMSEHGKFVSFCDLEHLFVSANTIYLFAKCTEYTTQATVKKKKNN